MNRIIYKGFAAAFIALTLTACAGRKVYERPNVIDEKLFRVDQVPADSLSSANVSWRNIFTDATLQGHINKALSNNLDVRVAMQNVASAQAYLKQSKAAFIPTLAAQANYTRATSVYQCDGGRRRTYLRQPMGSHRLSFVGSRYLGQALCTKTCFFMLLTSLR